MMLKQITKRVFSWVTNENLLSAESGKPGNGRKSFEDGGRLTGNPYRARWGCFLPDLTRLARDTSAANLPRELWGAGAAITTATSADAQHRHTVPTATFQKWNRA